MNEITKLRRALIAATRELSRTWPTKGRAAVDRQRLIRQCEIALAATKLPNKGQ